VDRYLVSLSSSPAIHGSWSTDATVDNDAGEKIAYKVAKAALNQATRTIAMDFKDRGISVTTMSVDPGVVATRLNGWKSKVDMEDSVRGIYSVMERTELGDTGLFWKWDGSKIAY